MSSEATFVKNWFEIQASAANGLLLITLLICGIIVLRYLSRPKLNLPRGPLGLPLMGYLPFLGEEPFKTLDSLCRKYGNVFSLYLGQTYVVVLGDYPAVKEAFSKSATFNRPPKMFDFIPDGGGVSGANGEEWVEERQLVLKTMKDIGLGRTTWARLVEDGVTDFVKLIANQKGHPVYVENFLTHSITDNIASLVFGRRLPEGPDKELIHSATKTVMRFFSQSGFWNFFPWLCNLLVALKITSYYKDYSELAAFNEIVRNEVELHKNSSPDSEKSDFISGYLSAMRNHEGKDNEKNLVGNSRALLVGGSDTTKTSLIWLFLSMACYPEIQEKVHSELDSILGKERRADWEDRLKLPYTYAVILETMRWKTVVPINVARMTAEDINVCGYDIPKGTTILANIWRLHNDPAYWKEPEKFIPERFLQNGVNEVDVKKESFVPFSYGKRKCIGENVAMIQIFLYFTAAMALFSVRVPDGGKPKMEAILGITYEPVSEELCFIPRNKQY